MANQIKIVIPAFIVVAIFVGVVTVFSGKSQNPKPSLAALEPTPIVVQKTEIVSPDGKVILLMNQKRSGDNISWTFSIGDTQLYQETLPKDIQFSIPFNTFAPDNKFIFIKKTSANLSSYIVLSSSGKSMEISELFYAKYSEYKITDITGWAAPNLLIVNTDKVGGGKGPSFWFDVSSKSFIRLSNRFN